MKKIINSPEEVVQEMLEGMAAAYPQYRSQTGRFRSYGKG